MSQPSPDKQESFRVNRMTFKAGQTYIDDAGKSFVVTSASSSIEPTTFDLKDTLHKVVNNLLEHGGEHYKRMFGRSGSCIFTNAEVGAIREVVFRALKAKLSATAIAPDRDSIIEECALLAECASPNNGADHSQCPFCATAKDIRALKLGPVKHPGKE